MFGQLAKHCCMESMDSNRGWKTNPSKTSETYGPRSLHDFDVLGHERFAKEK